VLWIDQELEFLINQEVSVSPGQTSLLEIPKDSGYGDLTTTICMRTRGPKDEHGFSWASCVADQLQKAVKRHPLLPRAVEKIQAVQPGFINFHIHPIFLKTTLGHWVDHPGEMGPLPYGQKAPLQIEFVSANPTGPLTIAHGRQAAVGDTLAQILTRCGYQVSREYYLNDGGNQIRLLGRSLHYFCCKEKGLKTTLPENGYQGSYMKDLARDFSREKGDEWIQQDLSDEDTEIYSQFASHQILKGIQVDLERFAVHFDQWFSEQSLHRSGKIQKVIKQLQSKDWIYEKDGALWLRSTRAGDDKDRVVKKKDGSYTYLAPDMAYHEDKFLRGFKSLINIWGPDHHGYIARVKAAIQALGYARDSLRVMIIQLTTLFRDGAPVRMSTRQGEFVTLKELVDEVGKDASRFFFLMRRADTPLDFDLELAKKQSKDNPVYYVQYAHTRIAGILRKAADFQRASSEDCQQLEEREEIELLRILWQYPYLLIQCGKLFAPHMLSSYLIDLSRRFHHFYDRHRVVTERESLTRARIELVRGVKAVLKDGLSLLGVSAPDKM
jgi:arginyl-tRNA synthetase